MASVSCIFALAGLPALVLAGAAIRSRSDPARSQQLTKIGWIVFASIVGLGIVATVLDYAHAPAR